MFDHPRKTLVDLRLLGENFSLYKFRFSEKFCMGLNLNHFYRILMDAKNATTITTRLMLTGFVRSNIYT